MPINITCECGKQLRVKDEAAGKRVKCPACGAVSVVPSSVVIVESPPPVPKASDDKPKREWVMWAGLAVTLLLVVVGMIAYFNKHQRDAANLEVAQKVQAAKEAAGRKQWDEAFEQLRQAIEVRNATNQDEAKRLIPEMEQAKGKHQADRLLASAEEAIERKDSTEARRLLKNYLSHSNATQKDRASRLASDIQIATSGPGALLTLTQLSDDEFSAFQSGGTLSALENMDKGPIREIYEATLRSAIPQAIPLREKNRRRQEAERIAAAENLKAEQEAEARRQEVGREVRRFIAGRDSIACVAYSNDGRYVAAASNANMVNNAPHIQNPDYQDTAVWVWDAETGQRLYRLAPPPMDRIFYRYTGISFSPDGNQVAASREDGTVRVWDVKRGNEVSVLSGLRAIGAQENFACLAFSPDGRYILTGGVGIDGNATPPTFYPVRLWDARNPKPLRVMLGHSSEVRSVAFSKDSRYALSGGFDRLLILWDVEAGREIRTFDEHLKGVHCVALSPDGRHALSGDTEGKLYLWDVNSGKSLHAFSFTNAPASVCFSPDGNRALVGLAGSTLGGDNPVLLDIGRVKQIGLPNEFRGLPLDSVQATFSPDGRRALYNQEGTERNRGNEVKVAYLVLRGLP